MGKTMTISPLGRTVSLKGGVLTYRGRTNSISSSQAPPSSFQLYRGRLPVLL